MIYASDLDQTLIYSRKSFRLNGRPEPTVRLIEVLEGEEISFISERTMNLLQEIASQLLFVPVTTRTIVQYKRITVFQDTIIPKYAVTSNGGNILVHGQPDLDWNQHIQARIKQECMPIEDVLLEFHKLDTDLWVKSGKMADELFYYFIVERDQVPLERLSLFAQWLQQQGWSTSLQGRKVYLVPHVVSKRHAIEHIMQLEQDRLIYASGDSLLDLCLLEAAEQAAAPAHGEIYEQYKQAAAGYDRISFMPSSGIYASEEILERLIVQLRHQV